MRALDVAILDRLKAHPQLAGKVFEGPVRHSPSLYVVVWANSGLRSSDRYTGAQGNVTTSYTVHSVGLDAAGAAYVNERVMQQLIDFRPVVVGRMCQRVKHEVSRPIQVDRDATPPLYYVVDQFDVLSFPG